MKQYRRNCVWVRRRQRVHCEM